MRGAVTSQRVVMTVPLLAVMASASPNASHAPFREASRDLNRYQGPTGRPIVFAKKSFFYPDLSVQPSVLYRLVTLPAFSATSFGSRPAPAAVSSTAKDDYGSGVRYEDNAIDSERPPLYFKGDQRLYAKKSFGNFGLSATVGPKPVGGRRGAHTLQGGYYRPWNTLETFVGYETAPRSASVPYYEPFLFAKNQPYSNGSRFEQIFSYDDGYVGGKKSNHERNPSKCGSLDQPTYLPRLPPILLRHHRFCVDDRHRRQMPERAQNDLLAVSTSVCRLPGVTIVKVASHSVGVRLPDKQTIRRCAEGTDGSPLFGEISQFSIYLRPFQLPEPPPPRGASELASWPVSAGACGDAHA
ncbi:hypothetical protein BIW11_08990 [Tropilaelaps mercedesae]|uniref:Uncharacterized protein n=1 Tax=Tropilaelaps mercedesae TaxID=418985 RepID=A0A1V9XM12_9ACAR|nr:hypothetical protein BIW11_08990 [Tropilaelaps mercedesae]